MKTCPVCRAVAFDDALVCYGCLHRFDDCRETCSEESLSTGFPSSTTDPASTDSRIEEKELASSSATLSPLACSIERRADGSAAVSFGCEVMLLIERAGPRAPGPSLESGERSGGRDLAASPLKNGDAAVPHVSLVLSEGDRLIVDPRRPLRPSEARDASGPASAQGVSASAADVAFDGSTL